MFVINLVENQSHPVVLKSFIRPSFEEAVEKAAQLVMEQPDINELFIDKNSVIDELRSSSVYVTKKYSNWSICITKIEDVP